ncbi:MAG: sigma 54-interacting transcriptional regulator [Bacillota bacterium]|nr:sigma 54-interacting transcriptional regulator [Bacillota bacterium]
MRPGHPYIVYDEDGKLFRVVSNAQDLDSIREITSYVDKPEVPAKSAEDSQIIAESAVMKNILQIADQIANVDSNVLITGESGVGKGMIASYIHSKSNRSGGDIVEINCGAIPDNLIESELFGYESGAFTGAAQKGKPGLIEMADKGTLFLDEIGELPLNLQVKLLKFLQNHKITRVGGIKEKQVDVRVIAATNKDLRKMVKEGTFRDDLFYRLNVVPIEIPPLRERPEDIYPAACFFAEKYRKKYHKTFIFNDDFLATLRQYRWMGNMRELENYMERIVVMSGEGFNSNLLNLVDEETGDEGKKLTLQERLDAYEGQIIRESFERHHNTYKVADELGISQPSAYRKIKKYIENR